MKIEEGTLTELKVRPGDVVFYTGKACDDTNAPRTISHWNDKHDAWQHVGQASYASMNDRGPWKLISRAPLPFGHARLPSGDVVDLTAIREPFGLLDEAVQEALKKHDGLYQCYGRFGWQDWGEPTWCGNLSYRVKPQPPKPTVETVREAVWLHDDGYVNHAREDRQARPVWRIYDRIDGKIDPTSYRLEARS